MKNLTDLTEYKDIKNNGKILDIQGLIKLLNAIAEKDLSEGSDIFDHPCTVAVRALNKTVSDVNYLKGIIKGKNNIDCKKAQLLIRVKYNPSF